MAVNTFVATPHVERGPCLVEEALGLAVILDGTKEGRSMS